MSPGLCAGMITNCATQKKNKSLGQARSYLLVATKGQELLFKLTTWTFQTVSLKTKFPLHQLLCYGLKLEFSPLSFSQPKISLA